MEDRDDSPQGLLEEHRHIFQCPGCGAELKHPHESKHTIGETMGWLEEIGFDFVTSLPYSKPFRGFSSSVRLFEPAEPGNAAERLAVEIGTLFRGSREGGFFIVVGRRPG